MNYDIVTGLDNNTLNSIILQVYQGVYPNLFKNSITVGEVGIASVDIDINVAPTVNLSPSVLANKKIYDVLHDEQHPLSSRISSHSKAALLDLAAAQTFDVICSSVDLTVNYSNAAPSTSVTSSLTGAASVESSVVGGQNVLSLQIVNASLAIPSEPDLEAVLNSAFIPYLIDYLNESILSPIQIPSLQYGSLVVSMPVPVVQAPYFTAYSALGSNQPSVPEPFNWPMGCLFVGADPAALQAAVALPFPLGPSEGFDWEIISGSVGAQVMAPSEVIVNGDGSLIATLVAQAWASLTVHTPPPLPNFTFGPTATATLTATLKPAVNNQELSVQVQGVPIPTFSFSWGDIPGWINDLLAP